MNKFANNFLFGAATASYQIEGGINLDERGISIWDTFSKTPGKVFEGHTGDVACDHYHRYAEDFDYLTKLNADAYRMSIAWPRILPQGKGAVNPKGLAFYDRLIDALLERNIQPWITLYHWDLPQALQDLGGWCNRDIQHWFTDYALVVAKHFGDRVKHFGMLNEACVTAWVGHGEGVHAPGIQNVNAMLAATHHQNLAQGRAIAALRDLNLGLQLGTVPNMTPAMPAKNDQAHIEAAKWFDLCWNRNFMDPLLLGCYPEEILPKIQEFIHEGDMEIIQQPLDFLGLNYYFKARVEPDETAAVGVKWQVPTDVAVSEMGWAIEPDAFYDQLIELKEKYNNPNIFITENGGAFPDSKITQHDEKTYVQDDDRINYYHGYLSALLRAKSEGVNIKGYFAWSLMDNYEWACGYDKRFGLLHVNYETLERTPKASFNYLSKVFESKELIEPSEI